MPITNDLVPSREARCVEIRPEDIQIDPEFESLIPALSACERTDLRRSLDEEQRCRDPLVVWKCGATNIILDGHDRFCFCREKGYPFTVVEKQFADRAAAREYVKDVQLGRRNLSPVAESYFRGEGYRAAKCQGARTDLTSDNACQKSTAEKLAEASGVGPTTIRNDAKVFEAVEKIAATCGDGARKLLLARHSRLRRGAILRLASLDPAEQKTYIEELTKNGMPPRRVRGHTKRRDTITVPKQPKAFVRAAVKQLTPKELAKFSTALAAAVKSRHHEPALPGEKVVAFVLAREKKDASTQPMAFDFPNWIGFQRAS
jgi:hypothetical protein